MKKPAHHLGHYLLVILLTWTKRIPLIIFFLGLVLLGFVIFYQIPSPFNIMLAIGFIGTGTTMAISNLSEIVAAVIRPNYNRSHCPFCQPSKDPQEILSLKNGRPSGK